jgi:hypothetical protein
MPCDVLVKPKPNNKAIKTAKLTFFFIAILWLLFEDSLYHSEPTGLAIFAGLYVYLRPLTPDIAIVRMMRRQDVLHQEVSQYRRGCSR